MSLQRKQGETPVLIAVYAGEGTKQGIVLGLELKCTDKSSQMRSCGTPRHLRNGETPISSSSVK